MTLRVLVPRPGLHVGQTEEDILRRVLAWLRDPGDVESLILHAPNAHLSTAHGQEQIVDMRPVRDEKSNPGANIWSLS